MGQSFPVTRHSQWYLLLLFTFYSFSAVAQPQAFVYEGEVGITGGAAHYFGDLNNRLALNRLKPVFGIFVRKQFGNYIGLRAAFHQASLGYSDIYSNNAFQLSRNLSFNSQIWEVAIQGDFNFFQFVPGDRDYPFTPYITLGAGIFGYDPYAYLDGNKYFLRNMGTEGQGSTAYPDRKPYGKTGICYPLGFGLKYNLSSLVNVSVEAGYRFTNTDYLDDVSTTYVGADLFSPQTAAFFLQDRSYEIGPVIGFPGRQRGFSAQKDQYLFIEAGIAFTISSYRCPPVYGSR